MPTSSNNANAERSGANAKMGVGQLPRIRSGHGMKVGDLMHLESG